jgi:hypothetical protein
MHALSNAAAKIATLARNGADGDVETGFLSSPNRMVAAVPAARRPTFKNLARF